jgi:hypothetical protein
MLYKRWRKVLRSRLTGGGFKPPQAALVKARVVNVAEKARTIASGEVKKVNANEPLMKCRKRIQDIKTERVSLTREKSGGDLFTAQAVSGMKAARA